MQPTAFAQTAGNDTAQIDGSDKGVPAEIAAWKGYLDSAEQALRRDGSTDKEYEAVSREATKIEFDAQALVNGLTPRYNQLKLEIRELGPVPKDDEPPETDDVVKLREQLATDFSLVDGHIKEARLIAVQAQQLRSATIDKRRDRFIRAISTRSRSVAEPGFWLEFAGGFDGIGKRFRLLLGDSFAVTQKRLTADIWKLFALLAGLFAGALVYRYAKRRTYRFAGIGNAEPKPKLVRAFGKFAGNGLLNASVPIFAYYLLSGLDLLTERFSTLLWSVAYLAAMVILAASLARVFLAPRNEENRLTDLSAPTAARVYRIVIGSVLLIAFLYVANTTTIVLISPLEVTIGISAIQAIVTIAATIRILFLVSRDRVDATQQQIPEFRLLRWIYLRPLLWIAVLVSMAALVLGYVAFAQFICIQILFGSIIVAIMWLVMELVDTGKNAVLASQELPQRLSQSVGLQTASVKQLSVLVFGIMKMAVFLLAAIAMLLPWGIRTSDWLSWISGAFFGFQIGGLTFSMSTILMAVCLFIVGYAITRAVQAWLSNQFLPTTDIDVGLRNSISTVLGYVGFVIAAMLAISAAGLDLSNLAIVAGALSVGVGFGLQSIVNNFVSGLILLAERPIKAGDWVVTTGGEGTVRKISVRSTKIETFDRATIVVPNSTLITDTVKNWTHSNKLGRIKIAIGVGYDSDPDQVREILLVCINGHDGVLKAPSPSVFFLDFGADALMFEVRGFLANIENGLSVSSELRFSILRALREAKIEIPYPQRDIHIKSGAVPVAEPQVPEKKTRRRAPATRTRSKA